MATIESYWGIMQATLGLMTKESMESSVDPTQVIEDEKKMQNG